jgi:hypothetical protein
MPPMVLQRAKDEVDYMSGRERPTHREISVRLRLQRGSEISIINLILELHRNPLPPDLLSRHLPIILPKKHS